MNPALGLLRKVCLALALFVIAAAPGLAAVRVPYGEGILWKIEHPGVAPSYVFGTMHVNDPRVRDLSPMVRSAFNGAQRAAFEIIITPAVHQQLGNLRLLPEGRTLDQILGPELFDKVAVQAGEAGVDRDTLRRLKPWAVPIGGGFQKNELMRLYMGELPLDQWMQLNAQSRGVPILELETAGEQIAVFDGMAEADQVAMLRHGISITRDPEADIEILTRRYLARDIGTIFADFQEGIDGTEGAYARTFATRFVDDRNRKMVERMQDLLRQGGTFVAVGALHLPGEQGILRLLQRRGYDIVRVY